MHPIGEMGIVNVTGKSPKYIDKGFAGMLVGYADQHSKGTFRMWNIATKKISIARDITWLNKNYTEYLEHERNKQISDESGSSIPINKEEESASTTTKSSEEDSDEPLKDMLPPETVVSENAKISLNSESSNEL
jgi:hypothetical protein